MVEYLVEAERPFSPAFDEAAMRDLAGRVYDHSTDLEASFSDSPEFELGAPWRHRLGEITAPTLVIHGADDPMFPVEHGRALAAEIPRAESARARLRRPRVLPAPDVGYRRPGDRAMTDEEQIRR